MGMRSRKRLLFRVSSVSDMTGEARILLLGVRYTSMDSRGSGFACVGGVSNSPFGDCGGSGVNGANKNGGKNDGRNDGLHV